MEDRARLSDTECSTAAPGGGLRRALIFIANFLKHPKMVGTFAVSSPALVQRLLDPVDWQCCRHAVELGPGVGTITRAILEAMPASARLLALEMNADFVRELGRSLPDDRLTLVHGSAADLVRHLADARVPPVDLVVSGIPFSTMPATIRDQTLDAVAASLAPGGSFVVYQYANHVLAPLQARFARVERSQEWRNLVPVRIFRCSQPRLAMNPLPVGETRQPGKPAP